MPPSLPPRPVASTAPSGPCPRGQDQEKAAPFVHVADFKKIQQLLTAVVARAEASDASERIDWIRHSEEETKEAEARQDGDDRVQSSRARA